MGTGVVTPIRVLSSCKYTEQNFVLSHNYTTITLLHLDIITLLSQYQLLSELYFIISNLYSAKADQIKHIKLPPLHAYPAQEELFHRQLFHQPGFLEVQARNIHLKRQTHREMVLPNHHLLLQHNQNKQTCINGKKHLNITNLTSYRWIKILKFIPVWDYSPVKITCMPSGTSSHMCPLIHC